MPFILSAPITLELPGLFGEGAPYERSSYIDILKNDPALPPVNYDLHRLKPHSLPHIDAQGHIVPGGRTVGDYFSADSARSFWGAVTVLRLAQARWEQVDAANQCWRVSSAELRSALLESQGTQEIPDRLLIAPQDIPLTDQGWHSPNAAFVLSTEAAEWLTSQASFCTFGTSWRTSDFEPGLRERPVHKIILKQAVILECLDLRHVPSGEYFLSAFPLRLEGATESPLCPVLFTKAEVRGFS